MNGGACRSLLAQPAPDETAPMPSLFPRRRKFFAASRASSQSRVPSAAALC